MAVADAQYACLKLFKNPKSSRAFAIFRYVSTQRTVVLVLVVK